MSRNTGTINVAVKYKLIEGAKSINKLLDLYIYMHFLVLINFCIIETMNEMTWQYFQELRTLLTMAAFRNLLMVITEA